MIFHAAFSNYAFSILFQRNRQEAESNYYRECFSLKQLLYERLPREKIKRVCPRSQKDNASATSARSRQRQKKRASEAVETASEARLRLVVSRRSESARDGSWGNTLVLLAHSVGGGGGATPRLTPHARETEARAYVHSRVRACGSGSEKCAFPEGTVYTSARVFGVSSVSDGWEDKNQEYANHPSRRLVRISPLGNRVVANYWSTRRGGGGDLDRCISHRLRDKNTPRKISAARQAASRSCCRRSFDKIIRRWESKNPSMSAAKLKASTWHCFRRCERRSWKNHGFSGKRTNCSILECRIDVRAKERNKRVLEASASYWGSFLQEDEFCASTTV